VRALARIHKLYYADADHVFSADERFILAAVADAYRDLIFKTQVNRALAMANQLQPTQEDSTYV